MAHHSYMLGEVFEDIDDAVDAQVQELDWSGVLSYFYNHLEYIVRQRHRPT